MKAVDWNSPSLFCLFWLSYSVPVCLLFLHCITVSLFLFNLSMSVQPFTLDPCTSCLQAALLSCTIMPYLAPRVTMRLDSNVWDILNNAWGRSKFSSVIISCCQPVKGDPFPSFFILFFNCEWREEMEGRKKRASLLLLLLLLLLVLQLCSEMLLHPLLFCWICEWRFTEFHTW